jgi:hypothetical protein
MQLTESSPSFSLTNPNEGFRPSLSLCSSQTLIHLLSLSLSSPLSTSGFLELSSPPLSITSDQADNILSQLSSVLTQLITLVHRGTHLCSWPQRPTPLLSMLSLPLGFTIVG